MIPLESIKPVSRRLKSLSEMKNHPHFAILIPMILVLVISFHTNVLTTIFVYDEMRPIKRSTSVVDNGGELSLRVDWTNLPPMSTLAKRIDISQSRCPPNIDDVRFTQYKHLETGGVGSNMHTFMQALCNAYETDSILLTKGPWGWMDSSLCPDVEANDSPMACYFGKHEAGRSCPLIEEHAKTLDKNQLPYIFNYVRAKDCSFCPSVVQPGGITVSEWMAAGTEWLFQSVNPIVIQEAERQIQEAFPEGLPDPQDLVTVNIRWGDKGYEMELVAIEKYLDAVKELIKDKPKDSKTYVYLASEDPRAIEAFLKNAPSEWSIHMSGPKTPEDNNKITDMTSGKAGLESFGALLLSMQANNYVVTTGSNWSRLINELRKNIIDPRCGFCTRLVDLESGEWPKCEGDFLANENK